MSASVCRWSSAHCIISPYGVLNALNILYHSEANLAHGYHRSKTEETRLFF